jgi:hypothetical protein
VPVLDGPLLPGHGNGPGSGGRRQRILALFRSSAKPPQARIATPWPTCDARACHAGGGATITQWFRARERPT